MKNQDHPDNIIVYTKKSSEELRRLVVTPAAAVAT